MVLIKGLFTILAIVAGINAITSLLVFFPKNQFAETSANKESSWSYKDTIWLVIMLISIIGICVLASFLSTQLNSKLGRWFYGVIIASCFLRQIASVFSNTETVSHLLKEKQKENLNIKETTAILSLAIVFGYLNSFNIPEKIQTFCNECQNPIIGDLIILIFYIFIISFCVFLICSLSVAPLKNL